MLLELAVKNLAIIKDIRLSFTKGFNVITGETGAGKSIVLEAISMLYGRRANTEIIRTGEDFSYIEGVFESKSLSDELLKYIEERGIEIGDFLVVRRLIYRDKPSRIFVNDVPVTLGFLSSFGTKLISLLSQNEHQKLFNTAVQLELLDSYLGLEEVKRLKILYYEFKDLKSKYENLLIKSQDIQKEREYLEYQIKEVEELDPKLMEEEDLKKLLDIAKNSKTVLETLNSIENLLVKGDNSVNTGIVSLISRLISVENDKNIEDLKKFLDDILLTNDKIYELLPEIYREYEFNPEKVSDAEYRLSEIRRLEKKFNCLGTEGILEEYEKMQTNLQNLTHIKETINIAKQAYLDKEKEYLDLAKQVSNKRHQNKEQFSEKIVSVLKTLGIKNPHFFINIEESNPTERGLDRVTFMFSGNLGEDIKPISKVASGGELSRVMLAIQSLTNTMYDYGIEIYDEIDTGIGGDIAFSVGDLLKKISNEHQLIVISHLPQIASSADNHIFISKNVVDSRTVVQAKNLSREEQKKEINRMMGLNKNDDFHNSLRSL